MCAGVQRDTPENARSQFYNAAIDATPPCKGAQNLQLFGDLLPLRYYIANIEFFVMRLGVQIPPPALGNFIWNLIPVSLIYINYCCRLYGNVLAVAVRGEDKPMLRPPPLSPEAKDLLALWESKRQGRNMPSAGDFSAEELKRWSSCLIVLHAADNKDRFAYHSVGAEIAKYFSVDATGRKLSDIVDCRSLWAYGRIFEAMSLKIRPAHFVGPFDRAAHKVEVMERLILPCGEGRVVEHLLVYLRETDSSRGVVCYELL